MRIHAEARLAEKPACGTYRQVFCILQTVMPCAKMLLHPRSLKSLPWFYGDTLAIDASARIPDLPGRLSV